MRTALLALLATVGAEAHFSLVYPPSDKSFEDGGKGLPPCGSGPGSNVVTAVTGGRPLTLRINEFVFHPGHYRVALSVSSRDELPPDPAVVTDGNGDAVSAAIQNPVRLPVLADGLFAHTSPPPNGEWQADIMLPNINCEKCTLQVIQFMAEHGPNFGGGYFYHHCADLKITADPSPAPASYLALTAAGMALHLLNPANTAVPVTVVVHPDEGPEVRNVTTLGPNASLKLAVEQRGWAEIRSVGPVAGYGLWRGAVLPLALPAVAVLPYDNADGVSTTLSLANPTAAPVSVTLAPFDDSGQALETRTVTLPANGRVEVPLGAPGRGQVRLQSAVPIVAAALRNEPNGGVAALPPL